MVQAEGTGWTKIHRCREEPLASLCDLPRPQALRLSAGVVQAGVNTCAQHGWPTALASDLGMPQCPGFARPRLSQGAVGTASGPGCLCAQLFTHGYSAFGTTVHVSKLRLLKCITLNSPETFAAINGLLIAAHG